jgi:hypothetical protein
MLYLQSLCLIKPTTELKESYLENAFCRIWLSNGIIFVEYKSRLVMNMEAAKQIVHDRLKISDGVSRPLFLDARNLVSIDRATMKYYKTKEVVQYITSAAFLTGSALTTLASNIFLELEKPLVPTRLFTDEKKALRWLGKYNT